MTNSILSLETITKTFRDVNEVCPALGGISLEVYDNEILCIMGPSGCGKSTLLRIIDNLEKADTGTITETPKKTTGNLSVSMVFQDHALFPWLTIYKNIVYGLSLKAQEVSKNEINRRVEELLSLTHLESFAHSYPHQLSGGMKQRVAVARALAVKPQILLMDEPFSALDPFTRRELEDEVERIHDETNTTIVLVTHNPEEAVYLADRIIILSNRPSVVSKTLEVNLSRPRNPADLDFINLREIVTKSVQGKPE